VERAEAERFARAWIDAWNAGDLAAILEHYAEDIVLHSPQIAIVMDTPRAFIEGKAGLRDYWQRALELIPELHFELKSVLVGSDSLTILYRNHRAQDVAETLVFGPGDRVIRGVATYE
jgi:ketosteroid isomerase-like protein